MIEWVKKLLARLPGARKRTDQQKLGDAGEAAAARFLRATRGMEILARQWRNPRNQSGEIDLVCRDGEVLVFVEVRTRAPEKIEHAYVSVNRRKKAAIKRAARAYLSGLGPRRFEISYRFDIVIVAHAADGTLTPHHFENVPLFSPGKYI